MTIKHKSFSIQKRGNSEAEYEDAFAAKELSESEFRYAVADGATESSFASSWANLLTEGYIENSKIESLQETWQSNIDAMELPWYSKEKAEQGAFAAFIGLTIKSTESNSSWEAISIGDCNLFHLRKNQLLKAFPLTKASQFDNTPKLLCSLSKFENEQPEFEHAQGKWKPEDRILLMSDALAVWFLHALEDKEDPLESLDKISSAEEFEELIEDLRDKKNDNNLPKLKNDDVTLLRITLN